jgi:2-polyprenyl-6-methoxyphenol hydroxylase-like FAD-dependent oxidoreductase
VRGIVPGGTHSEVILADGRRVHARLVVAADSRFSSTRRMLGIGARMRDFGKSMLVCRMQIEVPHRHTAWEWFGYGRTMALLPLNGDQASAVITLPRARSRRCWRRTRQHSAAASAPSSTTGWAR